jgi:hypothetical protein
VQSFREDGRAGKEAMVGEYTKIGTFENHQKIERLGIKK